MTTDAMTFHSRLARNDGGDCCAGRSGCRTSSTKATGRQRSPTPSWRRSRPLIPPPGAHDFRRPLPAEGRRAGKVVRGVLELGAKGDLDELLVSLGRVWHHTGIG